MFFKKTKMTFKEEIKRILISYALVPVIVCSVIFLATLTLFWHRTLAGTSADAGEAAAEDIQSLVAGYLDGVSHFAGEIDIVRFTYSSRYATEVAQEVYWFLGRQDIRGDFYLLDRDGALVFSTAGRDASAERFRWSSIRHITLGADEPIFLINTYSHAGQRITELQLGASVVYDGQWGGYAIFVIAARDIQEQLIRSQRIPIIVTDRFHRVVLGEHLGFSDEMGKLNIDLRERGGYVRVDNSLYHMSVYPILNGVLFVYAIQESGGMLTAILLISLLVITIVLSITVTIYYSANRVSIEKSRAVSEIVEGFKNVKNGDLQSRLHISGNSNDEFSLIADSYNVMVDSLNDLLERNRQQAQESKFFRVKQLESQFNPHFLFNSLENVRFMIRMDPQVADEMIICLSHLLRYNMKSNSELVTLQEEMEYTREYLNVLSYRFGSRFQYNLDYPKELGNVMIPPLLFQPIVENSAKYGFLRRDAISVQVSTVATDSLLSIEISDNGAGMTEERLRQVREELLSMAIRVDHIGICNVHQRIQLICGTDYGLEIESEYGHGTTVRFRLPLHKTVDGLDDNR